MSHRDDQSDRSIVALFTTTTNLVFVVNANRFPRFCNVNRFPRFLFTTTTNLVFVVNANRFPRFCNVNRFPRFCCMPKWDFKEQEEGTDFL